MVCKPNYTTLRDLIVGVDAIIPLANGRSGKAINFDNAATTPPFKSVLKKIVEYSPWYSSIHRGTGFKSRYSSRIFEESREVIADFVGADLNKDSIIFVKNATEGINKLSYRLKDTCARDVILSTSMEHHSNDLPWRDKFKVDYVDLDEKGRFSLEDFEKKLEIYGNRIKLVAVTGASNVTGHMNPIHEIAQLTHRHGGKILVDGAQLVPHCPINMKPHSSPEHIDYLVFSGHKMYAPFGTGVLIGPQEDFTSGEPEYSGGGTIQIVTPNKVKWAEPPHKEEAGTQNVIGVVALCAAIETLTSLGMNRLHSYERRLTKYATENLKEIDEVELYGDTENYQDKVSIITFNMKGIDHETLANILSYEGGIAVRNGCFCAHPYLKKLLKIDDSAMTKLFHNPNLNRPGMVRLSFGLYNNFYEIDKLVSLLKAISNNKDFYFQKYKSISVDL